MKLFTAIALVFFITVMSGCGSVISRNVLDTVDRNVTLELVQANPGAYTGKNVVWGGVIVASENLEKATEIQVLETSLAWDDTPEGPEQGVSRGRFIIESPGYLDTAIFKEGKLITAAGTVKGVKTRKIGKMDYYFPVIFPVELKISEPLPDINYYDYPPPWWWYEPYDPFWPGPYPPGYPRRPYFHNYPYPYWRR